MKTIELIREEFEEVFATLGFQDLNNIRLKCVDIKKYHCNLKLRNDCICLLNTGTVEISTQFFIPRLLITQIFYKLSLKLSYNDGILQIDDLKYNRLITLGQIINS